MKTEAPYRELVERAGAVFVGVRNGTVLFRDGERGRVLTLYLSACRSIEDVELALKAEREQLREFTAWEKAGIAFPAP